MSVAIGAIPRVEKSVRDYRRKPGTVRKVFYWRRDVIGQRALIVGLKIAHQRMTDEQLVKLPWKENGVTEEYLYSQMKVHYPEIFVRHLEVTGEELSSNKIYNRVHKMFYDNSRPKPERQCISREHPLNNRKLGLIEPQVTAAFYAGTLSSL